MSYPADSQTSRQTNRRNENATSAEVNSLQAVGAPSGPQWGDDPLADGEGQSCWLLPITKNPIRRSRPSGFATVTRLLARRYKILDP